MNLGAGGVCYSVTVSKTFYWKEGRLNASLNRDRDGQQTVVEILSKIFQFQSRHGYGGGGRPGFGMGASKTGEGLNKQLMRPLMTTLAPKTLGKYQDASKYWRWVCSCVAKSIAAQLQRKLLINKSENKIAKKVKCERDLRDISKRVFALSK